MTRSKSSFISIATILCSNFFLLFIIFSTHAIAEELTTVVPVSSTSDTLLERGGLGSGSEELPEDLTQVGLARLLNFDLVVTLPGRKEEKLSHTGSAVFVLSAEDIKRSGARHIVDALRLIPGMNVAQASSGKWAVSIRGFNQIFANKLLVLVDGVSVFSPLTNGVYWESNELVLDDVDRIEVIRGPGAALWGSNAVNGVINIISKNAKDVQGWNVVSGGGTHDRFFQSVRNGSQIGEDTYLKLYGTYRDRAQNRFRAGGDAQDDWQSVAAGFRVDSEVTKQDTLRVITDFQHQEDTLSPVVPTLTPPFVDTEGFNNDTRWTGIRSQLNWKRDLGDDSELESLVSYSHTDRSSGRLLQYQYNQVNIDSQIKQPILSSHTLVAGARYRYFRNSADDSPAHEVNPKSRTTHLGSIFLHDEWNVIDDKLKLIFGSKAVHNDHNGFEFSPNVRAVFFPDEQFTVWAAVSRALADPAILFEDATIPIAAFPNPDVGLTQVVSAVGQRDLESEKLVAYETGVRGNFGSDLSFDIALFYNDYDDIFSIEPGVTDAGFSSLGGFALLTPLEFSNALTAESYGGEATVEWRALPWMRVLASYSYLRTDVELGDSTDVGDLAFIEGASPDHQVSLQSHLDLTEDLQVSLLGRFVDRLTFGDVDSYIELNARVGWRINDRLEIEIVGNNLLSDSHQEFESNLFGPAPTEIERAFFGLVRYKL